MGQCAGKAAPRSGRGHGGFGGGKGRPGGGGGGKGPGDDDDDDDEPQVGLSGRRRGSKSKGNTKNLPPCNEAFDRKMIKWHNYYREKHGVRKVVPDLQLCRYAQQWANELARMDAFRHRSNSPYGENIYMSFSSKPGHRASAKKAVKSWYDEIRFYSFERPRFSGKTGHFTQVVWKNCLKVGSGRAKSASGRSIVVSNYSPRGNNIRRMRKNVLPLIETGSKKASL